MSAEPVVCLSSLPWDSSLATSRHHMARLLAERTDVLFVDPPGNLLRQGRQRPRLDRPADGLARLWRLVPPAHLPYGSRWRLAAAGPENRRRYGRAVRDAARELGFAQPVLWTVFPIAFARGAAERVGASRHVAHVTDSPWDYPSFHRGIAAELDRLLSTADAVVATTEGIAEGLRAAAPEAPVHVLPHGVEVELFAPVAEGRLQPPDDLAGRPRPRLGFVGNMERRFDVEAVLAMASGPGSVTLVGPSTLAEADRRRLEAAGVHFASPVRT